MQLIVGSSVNKSVDAVVSGGLLKKLGGVIRACWRLANLQESEVGADGAADCWFVRKQSSRGSCVWGITKKNLEVS